MKSYHKNPRTITEKQLTDLERWLRDLGDLSGIVHDLNSDEIVSGNQRGRVFDINKCDIQLANEMVEPNDQGTVALGYIIWEDQRYTYRAVRWTPEQCEQANIVANKAGGTWDFDTLANEFNVDNLLDWGFTDLEFDLSGVDFGNGSEPPADPGPQMDKAAELQEKWGVKLGDVWELGEHRLACGDCTDKAVVDAVMMREQVQSIVTDPPYGIDLDTDYTRFTTGFDVPRTAHKQIEGDDKLFDPRPFLEFETAVLWGANFFGRHLPIGSWFVWDKRFKSGTAFLSDAELAWAKGGHGIYIFSLTSQGFVRPERVQHPTQKPVELFEWCIENSKAGELIYDPFLGSGTTLIACERLGRKCRGIEVEPKYVSVTLERWQTMTGGEPVRLR